jgi:hypothetical protein
MHRRKKNGRCRRGMNTFHPFVGLQPNEDPRLIISQATSPDDQARHCRKSYLRFFLPAFFFLVALFFFRLAIRVTSFLFVKRSLKLFAKVCQQKIWRIA